MILFRGRKRARPRVGQSSDPAAHLAATHRRGYTAAHRAGTLLFQLNDDEHR